MGNEDDYFWKTSKERESNSKDKIINSSGISTDFIKGVEGSDLSACAEWNE